jgi:hypothetical protein
MPSAASAGRMVVVEQVVLLGDDARALRADALSSSRARCPSVARQAAEAICSLTPATRISKNSSRLLDTMHRKRRRSSSGTGGVGRLGQHAALELQQRQLAVDEVVGRVAFKGMSVRAWDRPVDRVRSLCIM